MERRNFIKGSAIAALSVSSLPIAATTAGTDRSEWERAVRNFEQVTADAERYDREVWNPLSEKLDRIEDAAGLDRARYGFWDRRKAFMDVNPKLYHDYSVVADEVDRRGDAVADALGEVMDTPAPDLAALRWKLDQLREPDGGLAPWMSGMVNQTFADIERLLPHAH